ncbi:MAG: glycosyltransferase family 4 protein, partial [Acidobacteria bacterium]|nr:glycosyltransferase family 4 protein [Acidobacteriota bacterium]
MRVLILSQYYFPEAVPKPHELAEELRAAGHDVTVLTGYPHYPGGKLSDGYKLGLFKREKIRDVPVLRVFELPYHSTNPLLRTANYLSFMFSAPIGALFTPKCDVIYVWHPPLTIGIAALLISKIKRVPFVYDVQDIWGSFTVLSGMVREGGLAIRAIRTIEKFVARRSSHTIVQTAAGRDYFTERGVTATKISILPHWIDEEMFGAQTEDAQNIREEMGWQNKFVVLFAGNLGIVQGLESVIEAARLMPNGNARIVFMGDGTDKPRLEKLVGKLNLGERVQFVDRQPIERMPVFMSATDALLVNLKKSELAQYVIPSKTVAYLASGKPILMAAGGASEDLIREAKAGIV